MCPRLEVFYYGEPYEPRNLLRLLSIASKAQQHGDKQLLSHLHDVYHESTEPMYGYLMFSESATSFLQLPSLRSYECVLANGGEYSGETFKALPRRSSTVESISLRNSYISSTALEAMLGACKAFCSFEYTRGFYHAYDDELMPRDLTEAILPFAPRLEYLYANYEDDCCKDGWEDHPEKISMGLELRKMTALKTLVTGMQALTGMLDGQPEVVFGDGIPLEVEGAPTLAECLPENLEHLEIHGCGKAILSQAQELLDVISTGPRFQRLNRVGLLFNAEMIERGDIQLTCGASKVQLDIVLQTKGHRKYDLVPCGKIQDSEEYIESICTRIYPCSAREEWLKYRGTGQKAAIVDEDEDEDGDGDEDEDESPQEKPQK